MRKALVVAVLVALGLAAVPALAGDIVAMPTGNMVAPRNFEFNYIFWDFDNPPGAPENANIFEGFVGITDWLELDVIAADIDADDTYVEGNAYIRLVKEKPGTPGIIIGATNITGSDWLMNEDDVSPFALAVMNIQCPKGKPTLWDPLIRAHLAYGTEFHGDRFFGGLQFLFSPTIGAAIFNYQNAPSYVGVWHPLKPLELRAGWKNGTSFYSFGLFHKF